MSVGIHVFVQDPMHPLVCGYCGREEHDAAYHGEQPAMQEHDPKDGPAMCKHLWVSEQDSATHCDNCGLFYPTEQVGKQEGGKEFPALPENDGRFSPNGYLGVCVQERERQLSEALAENTRLTQKLEALQDQHQANVSLSQFNAELLNDLAREGERNRDLEQLVREYREKHKGCAEFIWNAQHPELSDIPNGTPCDVRCPTCIKADLLLTPKPAQREEEK